MKFLAWATLKNRIIAIKYMLKDKNVKWTKKALVIFGIIYLFLPVDIIPPVLFPFGFLDDLVLWIYIIWHLKDTLDEYWLGEKAQDFSKKYKPSRIVEDVAYEVENDNENKKSETSEDKTNDESSEEKREDKKDGE